MLDKREENDNKIAFLQRKCLVKQDMCAEIVQFYCSTAQALFHQFYYHVVLYIPTYFIG